MEALESEEPVYRMFTDILSRFIIRDAVRTPENTQTETLTPSSVKYERKSEENNGKPKVTFKEEPKNVTIDFCMKTVLFHSKLTPAPLVAVLVKFQF